MNAHPSIGNLNTNWQIKGSKPAANTVYGMVRALRTTLLVNGVRLSTYSHPELAKLLTWCEPSEW